MSGEALGWAKRQTAPCARSKSVLVALADYADEMGFAWPNVSTLASEAQLSDRHIKRMLKVLVEDGVILRCDVVDRHNGRTRACAYFFPVSVAAPTPKMIAAYERKVGGRVTQVSPSEGDGAVTLEGDMGVTGRVTTVSPLKEPPLELSEANASSAGAHAGEEDPFEAMLAAWPTAGLDNTDVVAARSAFVVEAAKVGDPWRLVAAARAYAAAPETKARTFAPPGLDKWLSRQSYQGRLRAATVPGLGVAEADLFGFDGPAEVRAEIVAIRGEDFARSYLDRSRWEAATRTVVPPGPTARIKLSEAWGPLKSKGYVLGEVLKKGVA